MFRNVITSVLLLGVILNGYNLSQGASVQGSLITLIICSVFLLMNIFLHIKGKRKKSKLVGHDNPNKSTATKAVDER
ncbi:hypothetical protein [Pseudoalteromonas prydzensis]|uniref:hypothetical protein n=1 Tax=Pseudoalteromonas prydzensis TaxID=182141 RepID=UPI003FD0D561